MRPSRSLHVEAAWTVGLALIILFAPMMCGCTLQPASPAKPAPTSKTRPSSKTAPVLDSSTGSMGDRFGILCRDRSPAGDAWLKAEMEREDARAASARYGRPLRASLLAVR